MLAHLRLIHNPWDELAWFRVLPLLPRIGSGLSQRLWLHISSAENPLELACLPATAELFPATAQPFYRRFVELLTQLREISSPAEMIDKVLEHSYEDYLVSRYEDASLRREDLKGLANFAGQYKNFESFLADVALAGEFSGETVVTGPTEQEFVVLSTIHQAKGLEWPVVMIPWLADGRFPTDLAINTQAEQEEERRVFHVAVTRAKDEVYLVVPQTYRGRSRTVIMMKPSRFLTELADSLTEKMELEENLPHLTTGNSIDA